MLHMQQGILLPYLSLLHELAVPVLQARIGNLHICQELLRMGSSFMQLLQLRISCTHCCRMCDC